MFQSLQVYCRKVRATWPRRSVWTVWLFDSPHLRNFCGQKLYIHPASIFPRSRILPTENPNVFVAQLGLLSGDGSSPTCPCWEVGTRSSRTCQGKARGWGKIQVKGGVIQYTLRRRLGWMGWVVMWWVVMCQDWSCKRGLLFLEKNNFGGVCLKKDDFNVWNR